MADLDELKDESRKLRDELTIPTLDQDTRAILTGLLIEVEIQLRKADLLQSPHN